MSIIVTTFEFNLHIHPTPHQVIKRGSYFACGFGVREVFEKHFPGLVQFIKYFSPGRISNGALRPGDGHQPASFCYRVYTMTAMGWIQNG